MMIPQETIQEIVNRIDIIEIIDSFVKLKRRGANYLGLCPFHHEKTPSFTVSPSKEIFKCFGCGKSGNAITFIMEHEKYSYVEALRWFADRYNVEIEEKEVSPEQRAKQQASESLYIINRYAGDFFSNQLHLEEEGQAVGLSYLKERGFRTDIIEKFEIGYNPEARDTFATAAIQKQYNRDLLLRSGLVTERDGMLQDNYRGRIIFPIHNQSGKIIGFGARLIRKNDRAPKYINTPENEIYVKSRVLFGLWFARQAIDRADECLLVEGYTDVVSLHQAGIENVVASGGTALTPDQLRLIKKYTSNLTILYDGDAAGVKAALRGLDLALEEGLNVKLVLIPDKEDPDSFIRKQGAKAFTEFIAENKKDFIIFQLESSLREAGDDATKRAQVVSQIADSISRINKVEDFTKQQDYIRRTAEILNIDEGGLVNLVNKYTRDRLEKGSKTRLQAQADLGIQQPGEETSPEEEEVIALLDYQAEHEKAVTRCLLEYGLMEWEPGQTVADYLLEEWLDEENLDSDLMKQIISTYRAWYQEGLHPTAKTFVYNENLQMRNAVIGLIDFPYELSPGWQERYDMPVPTKEDNYKKDVHSSLLYLQLKKIKKLISENEAELKKATQIDDQLVLVQTHAQLKKMEIELTNEIGTVILK